MSILKKYVQWFHTKVIQRTVVKYGLKTHAADCGSRKPSCYVKKNAKKSNGNSFIYWNRTVLFYLRIFTTDFSNSNIYGNSINHLKNEI